MFYTYIQLNPKSSATELNGKLPAFVEKYAGKELKVAGYGKEMTLLPVKDIHLFSKIDKIITPTTSSTYLYVIGFHSIIYLSYRLHQFYEPGHGGFSKAWYGSRNT